MIQWRQIEQIHSEVIGMNKHTSKTRINVKTRKTAVSGKFQASLELAETLEIDEIAARWAERSGLRLNLTQMVLTSLSEFIIGELSEGNQLNFDLVSFYPRLSGALSSRDADPGNEDVYVRGAVKARRKLMEAIKRNLDPVNALSLVKPRIYSIFNREADRYDIVGAGQTLSINGTDIQFDSTKEDEGIWLEKRGVRGFTRVAAARVIENALDHAVVAFDELPPSGAYSIAIYTRCGRSTDFKVVRCRHEIRVQ